MFFPPRFEFVYDCTCARSIDDRTRLLCLVFFLPESARGPRHLVTRPGPKQTMITSTTTMTLTITMTTIITITTTIVYYYYCSYCYCYSQGYTVTNSMPASRFPLSTRGGIVETRIEGRHQPSMIIVVIMIIIMFIIQLFNTFIVYHLII